MAVVSRDANCIFRVRRSGGGSTTSAMRVGVHMRVDWVGEAGIEQHWTMGEEGV